MNAIATASRSVLAMIDDIGAFADLPRKAQADITAKLEAVRDILHAPFGQKQPIVTAHAKKLNVGKSSIYRYLKEYKKDGALGLLDERLFPRDSGLPELFKSHVKGVFDVHQRDDDGAEVQRVLMDQLHLWRSTGDPKYAIPGYLSPPPNLPKCDFPDGWSPRNILRLKPTAYQRKATKRGAKDAASDLPPILTTRFGSAYLSRILFDDQDYDNLIADGHLALSGITTTSRPVSFNALDFYTACHLDNHLRIEYQDPASGKKKTLTSAEFQWFAIHILQTCGYRTDAIGTELIGEHKTAAFWKSKQMTAFGGEHSFAEAISRVTNGHVRTNVSGLFNGPIFSDLYFKPSSTGNFKFKTWIESAFRLLRTYMQALPGPIGSNQRLNGPAELHGIKLREKQLLTAIAEHLDPYHANLIQHELCNIQQFAQLIHAVYRAINHRTDHNLEAWLQCGFTREIWRPNIESQHWFDSHDLQNITDPEERRFLIQRLNNNRDELTRTKKLSPAQARELCLHRDKKNIARLEDKFIGMILPEEFAHHKTVLSNHTFTLQNPLWPDTKDTYVCQETTRTGIHSLPVGMKLLVFANPFGDGRAHLYNEQREYLFTIHRTIAAKPFDFDRTLDQLHIRAAVKSTNDGDLAARLSDIGQHRTQREATNTEILNGNYRTAEQKKQDRKDKSASTRNVNRWSEDAQADCNAVAEALQADCTPAPAISDAQIADWLTD